MGAADRADRAADRAGIPADAAERPTPYLLLDVQAAVRAYEGIRDALPGIGVHYAVKCQPHPTLLTGLARAGARFEVASALEISVLRSLGVPGSDMVFSHPVKSVSDIAYAWSQGVPTFAFDSPAELVKLRAAAPGAELVVRLATASGSEVSLGDKFGVDPVSAATLLLAAAENGFTQFGIAWHVGSQQLDPGAWIAAIEDAANVMLAVERHGLNVRLIDIGGGFPAWYGDAAPPPMRRYADTIHDALSAYLPPHKVDGPDAVEIIAEPGRAIAATAGTMVATVIGVARRQGVMWAHLDVGAWHGLPEALETDCGLAYAVTDSRRDQEQREWTLTGPSCDGMDTFLRGVRLSAGLTEGDRVQIHGTGAYTTSYGCSGFNGFPGPGVILANTTADTPGNVPADGSGGGGDA